MILKHDCQVINNGATESLQLDQIFTEGGDEMTCKENSFSPRVVEFFGEFTQGKR